jgi:2-dehydro-3-deoxyglucarate aldolase/4-hydroxy-2-oxoheptanedioate aldolase
MVPNVKNGAEAKSIVDSAKYAPLGKRGVIMGGANTGFQSVDAREFMDFANENTTIICQIESREGLENLDEIASTPGVDVLWVGQFDLSQSMGIPGEFNQPEFLRALGLVVETARVHGIAAGIQPGNLNQAQEWMGIGFNVISYGVDLRVYQSALTQAVNQVRDLIRD